MKKVLALTIILWSLFSLYLPGLQKVDAASLTDQAKATWLWNTTSILTTKSTISTAEKTNVKNLIAFCKQKWVTEIYLQINRDIPKSKYQYLVSQLKSASVTAGNTTQPILVQALDGSSTWITPDGDLRKNAFFDWVISYQTAATTSQRFSGIHLDVEPYTNPLWDSDLAAGILAYQNFVVDAKTLVDTANTSGNLGLELMFDIPFWYDGKTYTNTYGSGNLAEWMYQTVPAVAIMSYRDSLDGNYGGMWSVSQTELAYGKTYGKKTIISAEVLLGNPTYISFYEEWEAAMLNVLSGMVARISSDPTTSGKNYGFAVHDYKSWKIIKP